MNNRTEMLLPLASVSEKMTAEHTGTVGHPANLHMWWGRSAISAAEAALRACVEDSAEEKPTVFDPFCGFGGIPLAAQKLGLPGIAGDCNPVAVLLTKAAVEIPYRFRGCRPCRPDPEKAEYHGAEGLAEDIRYYGEWMLKKAHEKLRPYYPETEDGTVSGWLWARTIRCPNPACGYNIPMASTFVLDAREHHETWAEPVAENGNIRFIVHEGICPKDKETNKFRNYGARFRCPACGELTTDEYVKEQGLAHGISAQLMAVVLDGKNGRRYREADPVQIHAADAELPEEIPAGTIPDNAHWFSPPGFGFTEYADLFSKRQLRMLTTFSDLLETVRDKAASDALAAGFSFEGGDLSAGGAGALAYGQAVSVYLAFVIDKMADRNSTVCSWNTSGGNPRAVFTRQAVPMVWNYFEGNPFSAVTGSFRSCLESAAAAAAQLPCVEKASVSLGNAVTDAFPQNVLVCTELPYYSTIGYAHLSDFFYIWLRRSLKKIYPDLFASIVVPKDELSTVSQYYGTDKKEAEAKYRSELDQVIKKLCLCSSDRYPVLLFYEYRRADDEAIRSQDSNAPLSNWEALLDSMIKAGFSISAVCPVRSEPYSEKTDAVKVLIAAEKQKSGQQTTRRGFLNILKKELPERLERVFSENVNDADKLLTAMGQALAVFGGFRRVINADGTDMSVKDALQIMLPEIENYFSSQTETSPDSDD